MHLRVEYEKIWAKFCSGGGSNLPGGFSLLKAREVEISKAEARFPRDRKLILRCQAEVKASRGL
jgi:hypothetical protein